MKGDFFSTLHCANVEFAPIVPTLDGAHSRTGIDLGMLKDDTAVGVATHHAYRRRRLPVLWVGFFLFGFFVPVGLVRSSGGGDMSYRTAPVTLPIRDGLTAAGGGIVGLRPARFGRQYSRLVVIRLRQRCQPTDGVSGQCRPGTDCPAKKHHQSNEAGGSSDEGGSGSGGSVGGTWVVHFHLGLGAEKRAERADGQSMMTGRLQGNCCHL